MKKVLLVLAVVAAFAACKKKEVIVETPAVEVVAPVSLGKGETL